MTTAGLRDTTNGKHGTYAATYGWWHEALRSFRPGLVGPDGLMEGEMAPLKLLDGHFLAGLAEGVLGLQYFRSGLEPKNLGPAWRNIVMLVLVGLGPCKQEFKLRHLNSQLAKCMSDFGKTAMCCWGCVVAKRVCLCVCVC